MLKNKIINRTARIVDYLAQLIYILREYKLTTFNNWLDSIAAKLYQSCEEDQNTNLTKDDHVKKEDHVKTKDILSHEVELDYKGETLESLRKATYLQDYLEANTNLFIHQKKKND